MTKRKSLVVGTRARVAVALVAGVIAASIGGAYAQQRQTPGERAVDYRQSLMTVLAGNFAPVLLMASGRMPFNAAAAKKDATRAAFIATMVPDAFPAVSNVPGKTKAKPTIWTDEAAFHMRWQTLIARTAALQMAAESGDQAQIRTAANAVGGACKDCHDEFRAK
ncbi:MAG TPA: cytochrome c [Steroidobacteraceae bacterium]|nr:cytochrome c [Steroidobacteraceae bacterium]